MFELSAPSKSGYKKQFETIEDVREAAADLLDVNLLDLVEVVSPDGAITYCYASQEEADADASGENAHKAIGYEVIA